MSYVEHRKGVFCLSKRKTVFCRYVHIEFSQTDACAHIDGAGEAHSQNPGEDHKVIIPAYSPHNQCSTDQPGDKEKGANNQSSHSDSKDGRPSVRDGTGREAILGHGGGGGRECTRREQLWRSTLTIKFMIFVVN